VILQFDRHGRFCRLDACARVRALRATQVQHAVALETQANVALAAGVHGLRFAYTCHAARGKGVGKLVDLWWVFITCFLFIIL
jgi:hypothetical protein